MESQSHLVQTFSNPNLKKLLVAVLIIPILAGAGTGYFLSSSKNNSGVSLQNPITQEAPKSAQQDNRTFRDFAEGKITKKPASKNNDDYQEGTHILVRDVGTPVALTSSVVDLSTYESKKVKVFGETQKAIKEGWLMDVGKVEELK